MFDLEFRFATLFGLAGVILTWFLVWNIINYLGKILYTYLDVTVGINGNDYDNCKKIKVLWRSLLYPVGLLIMLGWLYLVIWGGWKVTNTTGEPQGVLSEPQGVLNIDTSEIKARSEQIRKDGAKLQKEGFEDLSTWRSDFFNKLEVKSEKKSEKKKEKETE